MPGLGRDHGNIVIKSGFVERPHCLFGRLCNRRFCGHHLVESFKPLFENRPLIRQYRSLCHIDLCGIFGDGAGRKPRLKLTVSGGRSKSLRKCLSLSYGPCFAGGLPSRRLLVSPWPSLPDLVRDRH